MLESFGVLFWSFVISYFIHGRRAVRSEESYTPPQNVSVEELNEIRSHSSDEWTIMTDKQREFEKLIGAYRRQNPGK